MKTFLRFLVVGALWLLGSWLFLDAGSFYCVLKHSPERAEGCYTGLEVLIGLTSPTTWMRPLEFGAGALFLLVGFASAGTILFGWWLKRGIKEPIQSAQTRSLTRPV